MASSKILAFAGSARKDSYNGKLVQIAADGASQAGADVTVIDLGDYPMPIFDEDIEKNDGTPEAAQKLKQLFLEHDGLLIASPEYNSSITPLLKNAIDWVSRPAEGEPPLAAYQGKVAGLVATSPGALGGLRGLVHVRAILSSIGVFVIPDQVAIPKAFQAFDESNQLTDERKQGQVLAIGKTLAETAAKLKG